jgi:hypothetical protein
VQILLDEQAIRTAAPRLKGWRTTPPGDTAIFYSRHEHKKVEQAISTCCRDGILADPSLISGEEMTAWRKPRQPIAGAV